MTELLLTSPVRDVLLVLLGAALTAAFTVARGRARERSQRRQLLSAIRDALRSNVTILDTIPASYRDDPIPRTVDLVLFDSLAPRMVGHVTSPTRTAVEGARGRLAQVQHAMLDHRTQVASNLPVNRRQVAVDNIVGKLVPMARAACESALEALPQK